MSYSLNRLYSAINISKQAFHQYLNRQIRIEEEQKLLLQIIYELRSQHPTMGMRDMYYKIKPQTMGRDRFEAFCKENNLMSKALRNKRKTTNSIGVIRFPNLVSNIEIQRINQVWASDITYYEIDQVFYYLTFILDVYTRRIIGHCVSERLTTEQTTLPALRMAIKLRIKEGYEIIGVIFHSDGGGQYYSKKFLELTQKYGLKNSMCEYAWENPYAERINGVIKNNYLKHRNINSIKKLKKEVDRSVNLYNTDKPHIKLKRKTPIEFEKSLSLSSNINLMPKRTTDY